MPRQYPLGYGQQCFIERHAQREFDLVHRGIGQCAYGADDIELYLLVGVGEVLCTGINIGHLNALEAGVVMFEKGNAVVVYPHIGIVTITEKNITLILIQWHDAHGLDVQLFLHKVVYLGTFADGGFHFIGSVLGYLLQLLHQLVIGQHMLIHHLQPLNINLIELAGKAVLQQLFVLSKGDEVVVMKHNIGKLGVQFSFIKTLLHRLQVGQQSIFLQLKIDITFHEPSFA